jgi:hypothetical protein
VAQEEAEQVAVVVQVVVHKELHLLLAVQEHLDKEITEDEA